MAGHLVLSRKYRPQRFEDLIGQEAVVQTLRNALASGRIGHAYLFVGPRGTGKTTTARIFAKALNCAKGPTPTPCGECPSCVDVAAGSDLDVVEMDAASHNGVDDVRALRESIGYRPARSRFRVWIVDEVHMLSLPAFNAFLKTLEEPPPQAKLLFCTTEAHRLPETFTSRVQRLELRRIGEERMADRLRALAEREGADVEDGVCERIADGALGGLRDAESLLEQLLACAAPSAPGARPRATLADLDAVSGRAPAERMAALLGAVAAGDAGAALSEASRAVEGGAKPDVLLDQCLEAFRAALRDAVSVAGPAVARGAPAEAGTSSPSRAGERPAFGLARAARSLDLLLEKRRQVREGADGRLVVELAAVELAALPSARDLDAVVEALRLESAGAAAPAPSSARGAATRPPSPARVDRVAEPSRTIEARATPPAASPPAPEAAAPEPAPSRSVPPFPAVAAAWPEILRAVESKSRRLHASLARATPAALSGDTLLVSLPPAESVARAALRDRDAVEAFRVASLSVLGAGLRVGVVEGAATPPAPTSRPAAEPAAPASPPPPSPAERAGDDRTRERAATTPAPRSAGDARVASGAAGAGLDAVRSNPAVRAVLEAFGARVLSVREATDEEPRGADAERADSPGGS